MTMPTTKKPRCPSTNVARISKKSDEQLKDENFRRQNKTFKKRGNKLSLLGAEVYIQVLRKGKLSIYTTSLDHNAWPLREEHIVSILQHTKASFNIV
jgi:hypothetical protein